MQLTKDTNILIIGLGVMGGSYARALSKQGYRIRCITKDASDIAYALDEGMIEAGATEIREDWISEAELIVFALYPLTFISWMEENGHLLKKGTLITDVSGVKSGVISKIQALLPEGVEFISAHPMAGRERSGVAFSDDSVFLGANYIVVPTEKNTEEAILLCEELGRTLGFSRISRLSAKKHDSMIAFLSQLTHCIAVTLMNCNDSKDMEKYTGDSFRDLTRIAKINENMWSELFLLNKDALLAEMDAFAEEFGAFRKLLEDEDVEGMKEKMRASTAKRLKFDKPKGNILP
ncbi:MAG: prephenate dehydrogenase [Clostridia bacterium]|nr:prephenate dehydrogenase [Clostridia bacterium]